MKDAVPIGGGRRGPRQNQILARSLPVENRLTPVLQVQMLRLSMVTRLS